MGRVGGGGGQGGSRLEASASRLKARYEEKEAERKKKVGRVPRSCDGAEQTAPTCLPSHAPPVTWQLARHARDCRGPRRPRPVAATPYAALCYATDWQVLGCHCRVFADHPADFAGGPVQQEATRRQVAPGRTRQGPPPVVRCGDVSAPSTPCCTVNIFEPVYVFELADCSSSRAAPQQEARPRARNGRRRPDGGRSRAAQHGRFSCGSRRQ